MSKLIPGIMVWSSAISLLIVFVFQIGFPFLEWTLSQTGDCFAVALDKVFLDFCAMLVALPLLLFMFGWLCFRSFNGHSSRESTTQDPGPHSSDNQLKEDETGQSKSNTEINPSVQKGLTCTFVFGAAIVAIIAIGWWYAFCSVQSGNIQVVRSQELSLAERASVPSSYAIVMRVDDSLIVEELQVGQNGKPEIDTTQYLIINKSDVSIAQYRSLVQEE